MFVCLNFVHFFVFKICISFSTIFPVFIPYRLFKLINVTICMFVLNFYQKFVNISKIRKNSIIRSCGEYTDLGIIEGLFMCVHCAVYLSIGSMNNNNTRILYKREKMYIINFFSSGSLYIKN